MAQFRSLGPLALIGFVFSFGLLHLLLHYYLVPSTENQLQWNGLDGFEQGESLRGPTRDINIKNDSSFLKIKYVGVAGLGHRLIRMSSAYHLARILNVHEMEVMWRGYCPRPFKPNIFELLFGNATMAIPSLKSSDLGIMFPFLNHNSPESLLGALLPSNITKICQAKLVNEMEGYTHMYDNQAVRDVKPPFFGKLATDYEFYTAISRNYQFRNDVENLFAPYTTDHTIFGIHIRAGNGEVGDFEKYRQLGQGNLDGWLHNFTNLLKTSVLKDPTLTKSATSAVIFLATDTESIVDYFQQTFADFMPIVVAPQLYPSQGDGVSYNVYHANLSNCLDSWKHQMMDMVGLGEYADVIIAGQYSSFTQSLPLSRILNDNQRQRFFCDVDRSAQALKCYDSTKGIADWFGTDHAKYFGRSIDQVDQSTFAGPQIFLPTDLDLTKLQAIIGKEGPLKRPRK